MTASKETGVEMLLRAAATTATWPETPDLRARVVSRVADPAGRRGASNRGPARSGGRRRGALVAVVALALVAALALAGVAGALGFRLPGVEILPVDEPAAGRGAPSTSARPCPSTRPGPSTSRGC